MPELVITRPKSASPLPRAVGVAQPPRAYNRYGEWGRVEVLHSDDNTVDMYLDSGTHLKRLPVASREWVVSGEDAEKSYTSGERDLPPVHARVFVFMPAGSYDECFIAPFSGFSAIDQTAPYMEDDTEQIQERITPSGWHISDDRATGSHRSVSPDGKTSLELDYGTAEEPKQDAPELHLSLFDQIKADIVAEDRVTLSVFEELKLEHVKGDSCTIKVFDTEFIIKPGKVSMKPKETTIEVDGDATLKTSGKTTIEATGNTTVQGAALTVEATGDALVKGMNVTVEAAALLTLKTGDAVAWMPNCIPQCPLGPVHGGKQAGIIKLCGR